MVTCVYKEVRRIAWMNYIHWTDGQNSVRQEWGETHRETQQQQQNTQNNTQITEIDLPFWQYYRLTSADYHA